MNVREKAKEVIVISGKSMVSEEQRLSILVPKGIVCVESALFHYGYSDFAP